MGESQVVAGTVSERAVGVVIFNCTPEGSAPVRACGLIEPALLRGSISNCLLQCHSNQPTTTTFAQLQINGLAPCGKAASCSWPGRRGLDCDCQRERAHQTIQLLLPPSITTRAQADANHFAYTSLAVPTAFLRSRFSLTSARYLLVSRRRRRHLAPPLPGH